MYRRKHLIGSSALLLFLHACSAPNPTPVAATPPANSAPTDHDRLQRLQRYQQCWSYFNDKQFALHKDCYDASATAEQFGYGRSGTLSGADSIISAAQELAKASPDARGQPQLILANGAHVASIQLLKGTNSGPVTAANGQQTPATNKPFAVFFAHVAEFTPDALKVVKERGVMDSITFASQLGLTKSPRSRAMTAGVSSPEIVVAKNDIVEKTNLDAQTARLAAWNRHDGASVDAFIADDAVFHDMPSAEHRKKEGAGMNASDWKSFSDSRIAVRIFGRRATML